MRGDLDHPLDLRLLLGLVLDVLGQHAARGWLSLEPSR